MVGVGKLGLVRLVPRPLSGQKCVFIFRVLCESLETRLGWGVTLRTALHVNTMSPAV